MDLTGIPDTDIYILLELDDQDLINVCQVNKYVRKICNRDSLWISKLYKRFSVKNIITSVDIEGVKQLLKYKPVNMNYKDFYINIVNNINLCNNIKSLLQEELYVYEDFYVGETYITYPNMEHPIQFDLLEALRNKMDYENHYEGSEMSLAIKSLVNSVYSSLPSFYQEMMSPGTDFTELDKQSLRQFINIDITPEDVRNQLEMSFAVANNKILDVITDQDILFLIYVHNLLRTNTIPINITWGELCSNIYVLLFGLE